MFNAFKDFPMFVQKDHFNTKVPCVHNFPFFSIFSHSQKNDLFWHKNYKTPRHSNQVRSKLGGNYSHNLNWS
jgi:hypothetical protein